MTRLTDLIRERRRRQENLDPILAIFRAFIDPTTKKEGDLRAWQVLLVVLDCIKNPTSRTKPLRPGSWTSRNS
jgi:hypothetical protein